MDSMRRWYEASQRRFSVRKYKAAPEETQLQTLAGMADLLCAHGVRIAIGRAEQVFKPIFLWYGKIRGTDAFAAVVLDAAAEPEMAGYVGEAFVLECTAMGLGTCWLGASYNKNNAFSAIKLAEGERVACIIAIGVPDEAYVARPRRSFEKLTGLTADAFGALPTWQKRAIECARRAPSALNAQPWRFRAQEDGIAVENTSANFGYGKLDCGIAMLHIELGAAYCGVSGEWRKRDGAAFFMEC